MTVRTVLYGIPSGFDPISPLETDRFYFDFTSALGASTIANAAVTAAQDPASPVPDPSASMRITGAVQIGAGVVSSLFGNSPVDGAEYDLTATATFSDGRVLAITADLECDGDPLPASTVVTPAIFRRDFPAFASAAFYPEDQVAFWIASAPAIDPNRWGGGPPGGFFLGQELWVAHMLTLERANQLNALTGRAAFAGGPATSRSVGGVSVSYDLSASYYQGAGFFNLTTYGQRYWYLLQQAGMGPLQF